MNYLMLAGNLGADPEVRFTSDGKKVSTLRLAVRTRRSGKEDTMWWRVTVWGDSFDKLMGYLKKGSSIVVMGEMAKPEIYNDREGRSQVSLNMTAYNISFAPGGSRDRGDEASGSTHAENEYQPAMSGQATPAAHFSDDEIPF